MRLKLSLKQLFLVGLLASPVWVLIFVALQGRLWGVGALIGQLVALGVILMMMSLMLFSDRLAAVLYRRRTLQPVAVSPRPPAVDSSQGANSGQWMDQEAKPTETVESKQNAADAGAAGN